MNFLHCDIKPSNIMIDRLGYVKVIDFGRAIFAGERVTFLLGSPMYMAPEIHRREPGGFPSDFFSLGLVGLELLRGEPLTNDADTDEKSLLQTKMNLPELLSGLLPKHVRRRRTLSRIMRRLLEPNPANRYGSAEEAEAGDDGLIVVDKQLLKEGEEAEYRREFSDYLAKLIDPKTQRVETEEEDQHSESSEVLTS
jgi:serine/threonine protein kinase